VGGRIDGVEGTANSAAADAQKAQTGINNLLNSTQDGFNQVSAQLGDIKANIAKLQESAKVPAKPVKGGKGVAASGAAPGTVSPDGTYTVKSGDSLAKIARANGVTLAEIVAANPGVDPKRLKVGQKINLPAKK
jgi:LysM repeat protein